MIVVLPLIRNIVDLDLILDIERTIQTNAPMHTEHSCKRSLEG